MSKGIEAYTNIINSAKASAAEKAQAYSNRGNAKKALGERVTKQVLGKHEEAIADYDKAIDLDPAYAEAYYNRGNAQYALGKHKEAIKDYRTAIDMHCENATKEYTSITCYKFVPIKKYTIDILIKNAVYFSDVALLNDPLECLIVREQSI